MKTYSEVVFACWSKACAPPPAGKGGSSKGGAWSARHRKTSAKRQARKLVSETKREIRQHKSAPKESGKSLTNKFLRRSS